jgi:hypothetical protein
MREESNKEGQEPWSQPIISRMPALVPLDVPNGVARDKGEGAADRCCQTGKYKESWGGNRTAE